VIGLSGYVGNCKRWGRNGEQLLQATTHELEKVFRTVALFVCYVYFFVLICRKETTHSLEQIVQCFSSVYASDMHLAKLRATAKNLLVTLD